MGAATAMKHQQHEHEHGHDHHEMPTSGSGLTRVALSATLHCLTGCAIGEVLGMVIGTALGFSDLGTVALAVTLAFLFGYGLTSLPLLRAGFALSAVIPIALAADTLSIATMEIVDNAIMLAVPGAMESGVGSLLFWGSLSFALVIAGAVALPVNRWLIGRGKGHAVVHATGIHGGPSPRAVGIVAAVAFVFGSAVLLDELIDGSADGGGHGSMAAPAAPAHEDEGADAHAAEAETAPVRGLTSAANGLTLALERSELPRGVATTLRFRIDDSSGAAVRDFAVEHTKRMHLIVVRRDLTGFQHLHPTMSRSGTWSVQLTLPASGRYRLFADFKRDGRNETLASDLNVGGDFDPAALPAPAERAAVDGGYAVKIDAGHPRAGREATLSFSVTRAGRPVSLQPYLGARGHLVALRASDLAYLHVHPTEAPGAEAGRISFATQFATAGRHRLFLQFQHEGRVRTAAFTVAVAR
ncbi:MAG TPA: DUF4396 domain-containing protein [Solirubrobacteraceae bacterium]|nr:DUF4396 domain-containing protein [Solirubrobacteraceae bacterium]